MEWKNLNGMVDDGSKEALRNDGLLPTLEEMMQLVEEDKIVCVSPIISMRITESSNKGRKAVGKFGYGKRNRDGEDECISLQEMDWLLHKRFSKK